MTLTVFAPAKINLSLRVGPPGFDGRHLLDSLVVFTRACGDVVELTQSTELRLTIEGPFGGGLLSDNDNLVLRAAHLLVSHADGPRGAGIHLVKNLPVASGIGGGSADAAATLIGLNALWKVGMSTHDLQTLGVSLGADVPACVLGTALRMTETGETITATSRLPRLGIVLVNPLIPCPTGPVYQQYDHMGKIAPLVLAPLPDIATIAQLLHYLRVTPNDLEASAIVLVPEIEMVLTAIVATQNVLLARMSGSGATCFGLYATLAQAKAAAISLKNSLASAPVWVEADEIN